VRNSGDGEEPIRQPSACDQQAEAEPADEQRQREEIEPAHDVLGARRAGRTERGCRRGRARAYAEREHAGDDMAVTRHCMPPDRVAATLQPRQRSHQRTPLVADAGHGQRSASRVQLERPRQRLDELIEAELDRARRRREPLLETR